MLWRTLMLLQLMLTLASSHEAQPLICKSMEINHLKDFEKLRNCNIVVGHVRIANLELPIIGAGGSESETTLAAQIASQVQEITDYLFVYRMNGLLTLEAIFPRLRIIRGQSLLFDEYSLVIYENRNLRELGLISLLRIQLGNVRIESNPMLCFVNTINWIYLMGNSTAQHYTVKNNNSPNNCPVCDGLNADYATDENPTKYCWNMKVKQQKPLASFNYTTCPNKCGVNGCNKSGVCCQRGCATGCSLQNCELCGTYKQRSSNKCVDQCIASFLLHKRECVTSRECRLMKLIPLGNECVDSCPNNHRPQLDDKGQVHCMLNCSGHFVIKTAADLAPLNDCVTINGSLSFELANIKEKIVDALARALGSVQEITGYVKVLRSPQLMSLSFFKNLDTIRGDELLEDKYALYVVDNHHMEEIWPPNHQVAVQKGTVFFHLNPRLCFEKIIAIQPSLKTVQKISIADVSPNSNGERVICGNDVRELGVKVEDFNATAVRIAVDLMRSDALEILFGYIYHYKEAPIQNVTMYDGRHGCGHDDWLMDVSNSQNRRYIISNLKPYTQYAFFVKTLTRTDYHTKIDAYSKIMYFRTLPARPTPVSKIYADSPSSTQILLHWWPPRKANGIINTYIVNYEPINNDNATASNNSHTTQLGIDCQCPMKVPYFSGPLPEDEKYYNKEQITYEEALPNLIYVSRRRQAELAKLDKFPKVKNIATIDEPRTTPAPKVIQTTPRPENKSSALISNQTLAEIKAQAERNYEKYRQQYERKAILAQDNGPESFPIVKPIPLCTKKNASLEFQQLNNCTIPVEIVANITVPGTQHYLLIDNLEPNQTYRITVQACVDKLQNGCSRPTTIIADTVSKYFDQFLKNIHNNHD